MRLIREVSNFMEFYPSYKAQDVLNEYAITFFTLLNEGYRRKANNQMMLARLILLPHNEAKDRNAFLKQLEYASQDPTDILRMNTKAEPNSSDRVKKILGG